ncbi:MAG: hypothetical protein COT74_02310 [Bdellovibrionales bacterium CG10_big_fil_rev_8_21_14_0_10_45_34]|nr:MAG: hypothetical protein COT74_02310 [Bdellovibrionales bacterium CG10_big_fil_rev_8_21_14_0_10_45_34]
MKNWVPLAGLLILGISLILFRAPISKWLDSKPHEGLPVGSLIEVQGSVTVSINGHSSLAQNGDPVVSGSTLSTQDASTMVLLTSHSEEILLQPKSEAIVEFVNEDKEAKLLVITRRYGRIDVRKRSPDSALLIVGDPTQEELTITFTSSSQNGAVDSQSGSQMNPGASDILNIPADSQKPSGENTGTLANDSQIANQEQSQSQPSPTSTIAPLRPNDPPPKGSLPNEYIAGVVRGQKSFFNRCYADFLAKGAVANGELVFKFTILPTGQVRDISRASGTFSDAPLEKCITKVMERLLFKPFEGASIIVNYPIKFD